MASEAACFAGAASTSQLFASAINLLTAAQCIIPDMTSEYCKLPEWDTFDMIIVGGGTAGCVAASRLSEINDWNVLVLEAGPEPPIESYIPHMEGALYQSKYDWKYLTSNDGVRHQGLRNGQVQWPRGKMLGGCSSINAMFYVRGNDYDFQRWVDAGNPSWTPENVNAYFRKAENFQDMKLNEDPEIYETYGHDGPLVINTFNSTYKETVQNVLDSWNHIGVKQVPDINAAKFQGRGLCAVARSTAANGERQSTYKTYLKMASKRQNLKIVTNAFVTKILIDKDLRAYGVEVDINGSHRTYFANLEVILSAGTINTAQLLMLSGIGPKKHLKSKNIPCKVDLPVGKNLNDHPYVPIIFYGDKPGPNIPEDMTFEAIKYLYNKTGYYSHGTITNMGAFFSRNNSMTYPEFQCHLILFPQNSTGARKYLNTFEDHVADSMARYMQNKSMFITALHLLHPESMGELTLKSRNPYDYPNLDCNYLGDKRDIRAYSEGIQIVTSLLNTPFFKSIKAFTPVIDLPQCKKYKFRSDSYWKCYSLQMAQTVFHPLSTAKMGPNPKDSVVNNFLKVHGVKGLRIIDASVMPSQISGNTNAAVIMVGEMGADMVKDEYLAK